MSMKKVTIVIELLVEDLFSDNDVDILTEICTDFTIDLVNNNCLANITEAWLDDIIGSE